MRESRVTFGRRFKDRVCVNLYFAELSVNHRQKEIRNFYLLDRFRFLFVCDCGNQKCEQLRVACFYDIFVLYYHWR